MALQFFSPELTKKFCPPEPIRCSGRFGTTVNINETVTLWKSTEPVKGSFVLELNASGTPVGAIAVFSIKRANGTVISRNIGRGASYALTVDNAVEATVRVINAPSDQTASVFFDYCSLDIMKTKTSKGTCCSPAFSCPGLISQAMDWETEPLFIWESFFPIKGILNIIFLTTSNPADHPTATVKVERFKKPDVIRTIPLDVTNTNNSVVPFTLVVDDIKKVTITTAEIDPVLSFVSILSCHQEENNSLCCDEPFSCEHIHSFGEPPIIESIKIWESLLDVKGTYAILNGYDEALTVRIQFNNKKTLEKTIAPFGGFAITAKGIKDITLSFNQPGTQMGSLFFQYCIQEGHLQKNLKPSCCPTPLHCNNITFASNNNPQNQTIPLWISKIPVDGEILISVEGQPEQITKVIIKRFEKPDIIRTFEGNRILIERTTDFEGLFVELNNGDPSNNSIVTSLCIQEQVSSYNPEIKNYCNKNEICCPEPVKCEFDPDFSIIFPLAASLPLNREMVLWESTELIKGTFSLRNISEGDTDMTVKIRYKNGPIYSRTLKPLEGFMITDEGIVSVSVRFSSEDPEAMGDLDFELCTQNIIEPCEKDCCCPEPLVCQSISAEAQNIPSNQKYLLWHSAFPVKAMIEVFLFAGESATVIIERYGKNTITETIPSNIARILTADHIKNVFIKVDNASGVGSAFIDVCMQEEFLLKGDENPCQCNY